MTIFDRYAIVEYKQRFLKDRLSIDAKGYYTQFVRDVVPGYLPPSALLPPFTDSRGRLDPGGLVLDGGGALSQRFGGTVDADLTLPHRIRALVGVELFRESISNSRESYSSPQDPGFFGFVCPLNSDGTL